MVKKVAILGGGISGLSLAWFLKPLVEQKKIQLFLYERANRLGGWIETSHPNGLLFEKGPRGFRPRGNGAEILSMIEKCGLKDSVIHSSPRANRRLLLRNGKIEQLPSHWYELFTWHLTKTVAASALQEFLRPRFVDLDEKARTNMDESIYDFITRRFNNPAIADQLLDPVMSGIYGGDIHQLSSSACLPLLKRYEKDFGSIVKGMLFDRTPAASELLDGTKKSKFVESMENHISISFVEGMEYLIKQLHEQCKSHVSFHLSTNVSQLAHIDNKVVLSLPSNSDKKAFDYVFSSVPNTALSKLIKEEITELNDILSVSMGIVSIGFRDKNVFPHDGFGYLVPTNENQKVLGVVYDSQSFPQQNRLPNESRLSVMMGGKNHPWIESCEPEVLKNYALDALKRHLHVNDTPDVIQTTYHSHCLPQYTVNHRDRIGKVEEKIKKQYNNQVDLLGYSFHGIGIADCVHNSKQKALKFIQSFQE